ncbi:MAG TPA: S-ribosylhomocysteine lyase [Anaerolineales bacterium]|nr:S-ribosylhomocysteine lyase [Anaerolineales bacterium]
MVDYRELGWDPNTVGELDHRLLKAPHIKLRSANPGSKGDIVYAIDLRINEPNGSFLSTTEMHSFEHFLLEGFLRYLPNNFISIGLMGCQTGFYLILLNEGRAQVIEDVFEKVLNNILSAKDVPFRNIEQCGNYKNHDLGLVQELARRVLSEQKNWKRIV